MRNQAALVYIKAAIYDKLKFQLNFYYVLKFAAIYFCFNIDICIYCEHYIVVDKT